MKIVAFILVLLPVTVWSQIAFEPGYFVDSDGNTIDCLIRNLDWRYNPTGFKYKLNDTSSVQAKNVDEVNAFGLTNGVKYISRLVAIDRSSSDLKDMSVEMKPDFVQEHLFLKVLVESKASLYAYEDGEVIRYFYQKDSSPVTQLVYKQYRKDGGVATNIYYRQQLHTIMTCETIGLSDVEKLVYQKHALVKFFKAYNACQGEEVMSYEAKGSSDLLRVSIRPGIRRSSLDMVYSSGRSNQKVNYDSEIGYRLGLEVECRLPFFQKKFAVVLEPVYQYFDQVQLETGATAYQPDMTHKFNYQSIELPLSFRYYTYLPKDFSLFINGTAYADFNFNSGYHREVDGSEFGTLDEPFEAKVSYGLGAGIDYRNLAHLEIRYQFDRDLFNRLRGWSTDYSVLSVVVGWTFWQQ